MTPSATTDWASLLLDAGINIPLDGKTEYSITCPFHMDTSPSLSINIEQGLWICFAGCGQGSLMTFFQRLLNKTPREIEYMMRGKEYDSIFMQNTPTVKPEKEMAEITLDDAIITDKFAKWVYDRGFTKEVLMDWGCGTDPNGSLVIPAYDVNDRCIGTITRRHQLEPKYMYSKAFRKSQILFGGNRVKPNKFVCVVEGSLDAIWLSQHGYAAVALLGMSMSKKQQDLLLELPVEEVILMLDNDEAGRKGKQQALKALHRSVFTTFVKFPDDIKDIQEVQHQITIDKLIEDRLFF